VPNLVGISGADDGAAGGADNVFGRSPTWYRRNGRATIVSRTRRAGNDVFSHRDLIVVIRVVVAALALPVVLAACSAPAPSTPQLNVPPAPEVPASAPAAPATPAGILSERGNVVKQLGEVAGFGPTQDDIVVTFAIDKITVDAKCTAQYSQKPEHAHFVTLDVRAETKPTMPNDRGYSINPFEFSTIGADGITEQSLTTGAAFTCLDTSEQFPANLSPGSKYRGSIVLDTKNPSGVLVYRPGFMLGGGWEWNYNK
jgi:hypothetical protein